MAKAKDRQASNHQLGMIDLHRQRAEQAGSYSPLAARMRPRSLDEYVGQEQVIGPGRVLRKAVESGNLNSLILWGPPGSGKTTLAHLLAEAVSGHFVPISAVAAGVADLRRLIQEAKDRRLQSGQRTVLFIDEIHRFNKAQQDVILPYVEDGTITLIGATTENPSFEVNSALLSRARVFVLQALDNDYIRALVQRALSDNERGLGATNVVLEEGAISLLVTLANGDARTALNALELAALAAPPDETGRSTITVTDIEDAMQHKALLYDKDGEQHYDIISALHKTMRGSDPDAALYWLGRMLEAGEDPMYVARRVVRMAVEDIGLAAPEALNLCLSAKDAMHFLGHPEGELALAQAVVYLALAPKSNAVYKAYGDVKADIEATAAEPVPLHLRNAPTKLMKELDYGKEYQYAHDVEGRVADMECLPASLRGRKYYVPTQEGREKLLAQRMEEVERIKASKRG